MQAQIFVVVVSQRLCKPDIHRNKKDQEKGDEETLEAEGGGGGGRDWTKKTYRIEPERTSNRLGLTCMEQLYGDVILAGSVNGAVETKPNHENPPVHNKSAKNRSVHPSSIRAAVRAWTKYLQRHQTLNVVC